MRIRLPVLVAAFALVLAVAACGSDDTTTVTEPAGAETRGSESPQSDATGPATTEADVAPERRCGQRRSRRPERRHRRR